MMTEFKTIQNIGGNDIFLFKLLTIENVGIANNLMHEARDLGGKNVIHKLSEHFLKQHFSLFIYK